MNKTALKNFAIAARLELLQRVMNRANLYGVNEETCKSRSFAPSSGFQKLGGELLTSEETTQRDALIRRVNQQGYRQTMEEAAYTWFNRFVALRYMQEHQLLPVSQRVLPEIPGQMPEIIREAHQLSLDGVDSALVLDLLDRNETTALYRYLLISLCNALHESLPQMFEKISDNTELLFPDGLLKDDSVLAALSAIPAEDFQDIQVIGWLYQYYNTELKNETFELLKKNVKITKERIGAATQLFTPEWIVRYMVQNSLGRLWLEGHPEESLRMKWRYYMDEAPQEPDVAAKLQEIRAGYASMQLEDIKLLDPCMGSGHILVYAFDMLMEIYRTMGYTDRDAVRSIVENNLYGLDIDDRAAQLAYFAVMMKACEYDRRFLRRGIQPHVCAMQESTGMPQDAWSYFSGQQNTAQELYRAFEHAKDFGSLIAPDVTLVDLTLLESQMEEMARHAEYADLATQALIASALAAMQPLLAQARTLVQRYDVVVTNPPYMGGRNMNDKIATYVKNNFEEYKSDLFSVFVRRCSEIAKSDGKLAFFTPYVWMFLQSYEKMREFLYKRTIETLIQFEYSAFEAATVPVCTFAYSNYFIKEKRGTYLRLTDFRGGMDVQEVKTLEAIANRNCGYLFEQDTTGFKQIPGQPVAYWLGYGLKQSFAIGKPLGSLADSKQGMATADNNRFLRAWHEVEFARIRFDCDSLSSAVSSRYKWFPYNKGGEFRKWYGNNDYIINWGNDGYEIKHFTDENGKLRSRPQNLGYMCKSSVTWSDITSETNAFRHKPMGHFFDITGMSMFSQEHAKYLLGLCNTKIVAEILKIIAPTMHCQCGDVANIPVIQSGSLSTQIEICVNDSIAISTLDWDSFESSWDFQKHPLI